MHNHRRSRYFATDKDIFDLLQASKQKTSKQVLIELLRERGVFVSNEEDRDSLAEYTSLLPHSYSQLDTLLNIAEPGHRAEKTTCSSIETAATKEVLLQAITDVQEERGSREVYSKHAHSDEVVLNLEYSELDLGKTRLKQFKDKEAEIQFQFGANGELEIRRPASPRAEEVLNAILEKVADITKENLLQKKIELSGITTPEGRTKFFTGLINNIEGFDLDDVTSVKVDREIKALNPESELDDEEAPASPEIQSMVRKVLLDGEGLLYSPEYQELNKGGFYISKVIWTSNSEKKDGDKIELEASLGNPSEGTDYKYSIRGVFPQKADGSFNKNKKSPTEAEKQAYLKLLEKASWASLDTIASQD